MTVTINGTTGITAPGLETFGDGTALGGATNPIVSMAKGANNYVQGYIVNNTDGANASADLVCYPSNGTDSSGWVDMGVTGPTYSQAAYSVTGPNEAYLFGSAPSGASKTGNLVIATDSTGTANSIQFYTNGFAQAKSAVKMVIDGATGNVGIGTSSPSSIFQLNAATPIQTFNQTTANSNQGVQFKVSGTAYGQILNNATTGIMDIRNGLSAGAGYVVTFSTDGSERARIDSSGNLLVGTVSTDSRLRVDGPISNANTGVASFRSATAADTSSCVISAVKSSNDTTTSQVFVRFGINNYASGSGQINANGANACAFGAFSDRRLKKNIVDLPSQLDNILALRPVEYDYIESEGGGHQIGFVAQEVQEIYPDLVGERSDGMLTLTDLNKNDARLIKAIQEQQALITQLQADVASLKGKA